MTKISCLAIGQGIEREKKSFWTVEAADQGPVLFYHLTLQALERSKKIILFCCAQ